MSLYWNSEEVYFDGDDYFDRLIKDISLSRHYITLEMYMFNDDPLGNKVALELARAQKRGVKVQMIVDGVGSLSFFDNLYRFFRNEGIQVKMFNPLPFYHPFSGKLTFFKMLKVLESRTMSLNKRNHRKIITIDEEIMYAGSFNVTVEHTRYHKEKAWKDMGIRVTGKNVKFAVLNFKKIWKLRDYYRFKKQLRNLVSLDWKMSPLRLNQTVFMRRFYYRNFMHRIHRAERRVWLMTPYFIPKRRMIRLLGKAAKRGVDVRVLISEKTDVTFFRWLQAFYFPYLLVKGVKVYQYTDSVLHAKNFIIDDFMTIGSSNLNHRSFLHDLEVDLVLQDEDNKKAVEAHFHETAMSQKAITLESLKNLPLLDRILSRLFFLFKYWF